jgi:hypothetical protein
LRPFLLGVLCPPEVAEIDTASETVRLAGVENVPLVPSGKDNVCISTEDIAVVGCACNAGRIVEAEGALGRSTCRRDGLGGRGGRCSSSSSWSPVVTAELEVAGLVSPARFEASLPLLPVIESLVPFFDVACTVGVVSSAAYTRSWEWVDALEKSGEVPIEPAGADGLGHSGTSSELPCRKGVGAAGMMLKVKFSE